MYQPRIRGLAVQADAKLLTLFSPHLRISIDYIKHYGVKVSVFTDVLTGVNSSGASVWNFDFLRFRKYQLTVVVLLFFF